VRLKLGVAMSVLSRRSERGFIFQIAEYLLNRTFEPRLTKPLK